MPHLQHNSVLVVSDLFQIYPIIESLTALNDITLDLITDDTYHSIITFLEGKNTPHNFLTALPTFLEFISPLFELQRLEDLTTSTNTNKLKRLREELESLDKNDDTLKEQRLKLREQISKVKGVAVESKNELAELEIVKLGNLLGGEQVANLYLWLNSMREPTGKSIEELKLLPFTEFLKLSNIQQSLCNIEQAHELQTKAKQAQASHR